MWISMYRDEDYYFRDGDDNDNNPFEALQENEWEDERAERDMARVDKMLDDEE